MHSFLRLIVVLSMAAALGGGVGCSVPEGTGGSANGGAGASGMGGTTAGGNGAGGAGASGAGGTGGDPSDAALGAFCEQMRAAQVAFIQRCRGLATEVAELFVPIDPCAIWRPAVAGERMAFDWAADPSECVAALQTASCEAEGVPAVCRQVLSGVRVPGESCALAAEETNFSECEVGTACVADILAPSCEGTCVERGIFGEACSFEQPCVVGETCTLNAGCGFKGSLGSVCGPETSPECEEGLHCSDSIVGGTCVPHLGASETCSTDIECTPPLVCERGSNITGLCALPLKPGEACSVGDFECTSGYGYCGADGSCHADAKLGEPCDITDGETSDCILGTCDTSLPTPVCAPAAEGEFCTSSASCGPGALCVIGLGGSFCVAGCY